MSSLAIFFKLRNHNKATGKWLFWNNECKLVSDVTFIDNDYFKGGTRTLFFCFFVDLEKTDIQEKPSHGLNSRRKSTFVNCKI